MKCKNCGKENVKEMPDGKHICIECGTIQEEYEKNKNKMPEPKNTDVDNQKTEEKDINENSQKVKEPEELPIGAIIELLSANIGLIDIGRKGAKIEKIDTSTQKEYEESIGEEIVGILNKDIKEKKISALQVPEVLLNVYCKLIYKWIKETLSNGKDIKEILRGLAKAGADQIGNELIKEKMKEDIEDLINEKEIDEEKIKEMLKL